jgi:PPOX class probable FMN-dependent enzyme
MTTATNYRITELAQLRAIVGEPGALVPHKLLDSLDTPMVEFIGRSPFLVLATADAEGNQDASPKGDGPGFVAIEGPQSLLIPDRTGNKLIFSLQNILANPRVGLIFMVPGTDETLRVNGTAELTMDPVVLKRLAARGADAQLAIRLTIRECFFHCAKAFMRAQLWRPGSWRERVRISWGEYLASKTGADGKTARQIDQFVEQDYKNNL